MADRLNCAEQERKKMFGNEFDVDIVIRFARYITPFRVMDLRFLNRSE